jgi:aspartate-semialdehyde dehydrogenase
MQDRLITIDSLLIGAGVMKIAIGGASGIVGQTLLELLSHDPWTRHSVVAYSSERSAGGTVMRGSEALQLKPLPDDPPVGVDVLLSALPNDVAKRVVPRWRDSGVLVIDKSSVFRMDNSVPLIVPEVNGKLIERSHRLIATPNCTTTPVAVALKPILDTVGITDVRVCSYQSVSGSGKPAIEAWEAEERGEIVKDSPLGGQIHRNVIPLIGSLDDQGHSSEEIKLTRELAKILDLTELPVECTCVRVPTYAGHGMAVEVGTEKPITPQEAISLWKQMDGVIVSEDSASPPTVLDSGGRDEVFIGRVRSPISQRNALLFWVVSDNLRKGAATNALQILERWMSL